MSAKAAIHTRIDSLDGWRAIAISLILFSHLPFAVNCPASLSKFIFTYVNGNLGTRTFFTLSGFIITWLLLGELEKKGRIDQFGFLTRRCLRILPVYLCYLGTVLALQCSGLLHETLNSWLGSVTFCRNYFGAIPSPTSHLWSLSIEEQFYLVWPPLLCLLAPRPRLFYTLLAVCLLCGPLTRLSAPPLGGDLADRLHGPRSLLRYTDVIAIGCAGAILYKRGLWIASNFRAACAFIALILCEAISRHFWEDGKFLAPFLEGIATAELLLWSITSRGLVHGLLNSRPLVGLGLLSFALYIWHTLFLDHFSPGLLSSIGLDSWYLWWIPSLLCALASYALLEWPARYFRAKRRSFPSSPGTV